MKITVVAPLYRSARYIEELHRRCVAAIRSTGAGAHEIIFVNDGSPDDSLAVAKRVASCDPGVVVVDLSRNFGHHKAVMTGLRYATGDYIVTIDADLEEEPEWIALFYDELKARGCDVVYGVSTNVGRRRVYGLGRSMFYAMMNVLAGVHFPTNITNARIMTRRFVDALLQFKEREVYLGGLWHITGFAQLPLAVAKKRGSESTYTLRHLLALVINAITGFSTRPLIAISAVGVLVAAVGIGLMIWVLMRQLLFGVAVPGWVSLMVVMLLLGSLQLLVTGIVAIYIAKIFIEVKQRPFTIVREVFQVQPGETPTRPAVQAEAERVP